MKALGWLLLARTLASPATWDALYFLLFAAILVWRIRRGRPIPSRIRLVLGLLFFGGFVFPAVTVAALPLWIAIFAVLLADVVAGGEDGRWPRRDPDPPADDGPPEAA